MKKSFFNTQDAGKFFLWAVVAPQILALIVEVVLMIVAQAVGKTTEELFKIPTITICFAMLAQVAFLFVIMYCGKNHDFKSAFRFSFKIPARNVAIAILIGVIAVFAFSPIVGLFDEFLASIGFHLSTIGFDINSVWTLILGIILMAFVPAVLEELIFRGAILQGLKRYGKWVAILLTSAMFMLVHCSLQQLIFPFFISIIMCNCVLKTDNVLISMIVHFVANTTSLVLAFANVNIALTLPLWANILLAIAIACVGFLAMWGLTLLLKPKTEPEKTAEQVFEKIDETLEVNQQKSNAYLKIAIFIAVVFYIIATISQFLPQS